MYDVHGAVVAQERTRGPGTYHVEEFRNDAYGNAFFSRTRSSAGANDAPSVAFFNPDGALYDRHTVLPGTVHQNHREELLSQGAAPAALETTSRLVAIPPVNSGGAAAQLASKQYYSADQRLMVVQRYDYLVGSTTDVGTWEEYRYDALGRRILTRARRDGANKPDSSRTLCLDPVGGSCGSYIQRSLWDGDQLLYEWRVPEAAPTGMTSGSAGYVHLEGIDQPIGLIRPEGTRVINYTWRGLGESSVFTNGASGDCAIPFSNCTAVQWPGKTQAGVYFTPNLLASGPSGPYTWFGTLAENGGGSTGMLFRRNRYFDPVSGRFTQQDPIGLAGGINLYGYAGGDPINNHDPFGLFDVKVQGENSKKIVAYLLAKSATFREAYNRLDNDRSVHLTIQDAPDPLRAGVGRNSFTLGTDGKSGTILFNDVGLNMANFSLFSKDPGSKWMFTAASVMGHEMGHANAWLGNGDAGCRSDSPPGCILKYENQVRSELPAHAQGGTRTRYDPDPSKP